jgi:hypothetical protein
MRVAQRLRTQKNHNQRFSPASRSVCGTIAAAMTPAIVTNAIVAAISAGAVAGATDTAKSAIADAYQGLKSLIKKKFGHDSDVAEAIEKLEAKPEFDGRKETLAEELRAVNSTSDPELVSAAQAVLSLMESLPQGEKHIQYARGSGIAQADRGSQARHHARTAQKICLTILTKMPSALASPRPLAKVHTRRSTSPASRPNKSPRAPGGRSSRAGPDRRTGRPAQYVQRSGPWLPLNSERRRRTDRSSPFYFLLFWGADSQSFRLAAGKRLWSDKDNKRGLLARRDDWL